MKTRRTAFLLASTLFLTAASTHAITEVKVPDERPKLAIVVIDNLQNRRSGFTEFDRIDLAFQYVAKQRKWPVTVTAERLAADTPAHPIELRIFYQGVREDIGNEFTFRAWMTLAVNGVKHDLGIISYRYTIRPWENNDDMKDKIFRGAAFATADKIEPLLFTRVRGRPVSSRDAATGNR